MSRLSVIVCAHNPRQDFLHRVLDALKAQTLSKDTWELLLIDNGSKEPLAKTFDLSWHPVGKLIREDELGLTPARLRGIRDSTGELLVFVDDDNLLSPDYLSECQDISAKFTFLGSWGGQVIPEYEKPPSPEMQPFLRYLLIREFQEIRWSNTVNFHETAPCGAGMCLRRAVAEEYVSLLARDPRRKVLDRRGDLIFACGDTDMALCARRLGLGTGVFPNLKLLHLIPASRVTESFFLKAAFGGGYSFTLLEYLYGITRTKPEPNLLRRVVGFARLMTRSRLDRRLAAEEKKGQTRAWTLIEQWEAEKTVASKI